MNKKSFWIKLMVWIIIILALIGVIVWTNSKSSCPINPVSFIGKDLIIQETISTNRK